MFMQQHFIYKANRAHSKIIRKLINFAPVDFIKKIDTIQALVNPN